VTILAWIWRK